MSHSDNHAERVAFLWDKMSQEAQDAFLDRFIEKGEFFGSLAQLSAVRAWVDRMKRKPLTNPH